jgi:hypothetical protein
MLVSYSRGSVCLFLLFLWCGGCAYTQKNVGGGLCYGGIEIEAENVDTENLYFVKLLESSLLKKFDLITQNDRVDNGGGCMLFLNVKKTYKDLVTDDDGNISGKGVRYYVEYELLNKQKSLKTDKIFIFYNVNITKHQYSNLVLSEKDERNNAEKISQKIFFSIKKFF